MDYEIFVDSEEDKAELKELWLADGIRPSQRMYFRDDAGASAIAIGGMLLKSEVIKVALAAIGGWLAAKNGRKIRLKVGDIEVEATTVQELEDVIKLAEKLK